jgi:hypothetical protein
MAIGHRQGSPESLENGQWQAQVMMDAAMTEPGNAGWDGRSSVMPPSVDVLMLAYNVAPFIAEAVEGVLAQRTGFPVRLIIAEDGSTDGTTALCERLAQAYPGRILYIPGEVNLGIAARTLKGLEQCTAKYVAICDSDDRWTDPMKLADQVGFLEAHPDHGVSYTDVDIMSRDGTVLADDGYAGIRAHYVAGEVFVPLLQGNFINNSTAVARRELLAELRPNACRDNLIGDHLRWLQSAMRSRVHLLPRRTTAYRLGGITSRPGVHARNKQVMSAALGALILEHCSFKPRLSAGERAVLFRKTLGVLGRSGTGLSQKVALLVPLVKYIPASMDEWRAVFCKTGNDPAA